MNQLSRCLCVLILAGMLGCSRQQPFGEVFSEGSCSPPCWQGITPGILTEEEAKALVANLTLTERQTLRDESVYSRCRSLSWEGPVAGSGHRRYIYLHDGLVVLVTVWPGQHLALSQVVDLLGPPEYVEPLHVLGPDGSAYSLTVYYPSKGLALDINTDKRDLGQIKETASVRTARFSRVGEIEPYLVAASTCETSEGDSGKYAQRKMQVIVPWTGFGKVQVFETR